jgi:asparagine N-glycosylation enzyme membrane subunit Stt3
MSSSTQPGTRFALVIALVCVFGIAFAARPGGGQGGSQPRDDSAIGGWYSIDPDGLYHARRVARALDEGLPVAGTDPYLAWPEGAAIPWPPYYDTLLAVVLRPFAPADPGARFLWLERRVASLPRLFGIGAALVAAAIVWRLLGSRTQAHTRAAAAALTGVYAACGWGAINYSRLGVGDHHAFVGLCTALLFAGVTWAAGGAFGRARSAAGAGVLCGAIAALLLGTWVASTAWIALVQLALGWYLVRRAREELPGVASFGLALHATALALLAPAVLQSPWRADYPWMVVNLSWFHLAWLGLGALVFVPPLLLGRTSLAAGTRAARLYPWGVALALALLAGLLWVTGSAPARGVAEGFAWVSRADAFMDSVRESEPLIGPRAGRGELFLALGFGLLLAPLAWIAVARRAWRGEDAWALWVLVAPVLVAQALAQKRFSDVAVLPLAVLLGWGSARLLARVPRFATLPLALAAGLALQGASVAKLASGEQRLRPGAGGPTDAALGERTALEWIRFHGSERAGAVLAHWDRGHFVEWAADRPSVATNFGSYVGVESYRAPAEFFLSTDLAAAEALLAQRQVEYVYAPVSLAVYTPSMCRIAGLPQAAYVGGDGRFTALWRTTPMARAVSDGYAPLAPGEADAGGPFEFLRLVHVATRTNPGYKDARTGQARPAAFVWQHVAGAHLIATGRSGERLEVEIELAYDEARYRVVWRASAPVEGDGRARMRVPYATEGANGDARVVRAAWRLGGRTGALSLSERAVLEGGAARLE